MYLAVSFDQEKSLQEQQTIFKVLMNIKVPQEFNFIKALVTRKQRFLKKFLLCVCHTMRIGKALREHSLNGKRAASFLLKLFISSSERCHTTDAT